MNHDSTDDRVEHRAADLLPEELAAGSDDPQAQAEAILRDSDEREHVPDAAPDSFHERRTSAQTVTPEPGTDSAEPDTAQADVPQAGVPVDDRPATSAGESR